VFDKKKLICILGSMNEDEFADLPEDLGDDLEWVTKRIAELEELEKESTGVEPALCQRTRAEELAKRLGYLYGVHLGPLDIMNALMEVGVKLSIDSLGHVRSGYDSLKYSASGKEVVDLKKYRISKRMES
jgi:hypothetical protein